MTAGVTGCRTLRGTALLWEMILPSLLHFYISYNRDIDCLLFQTLKTLEDSKGPACLPLHIKDTCSLRSGFLSDNVCAGIFWDPPTLPWGTWGQEELMQICWWSWYLLCSEYSLLSLTQKPCKFCQHLLNWGRLVSYLENRVKSSILHCSWYSSAQEWPVVLSPLCYLFICQTCQNRLF